MTIGKIIYKLGKAIIISAIGAVAAKATYSAAKAVKKTKADVEEREAEKTYIDYSEDPDGVTVYEKEIVSKKEVLQMYGWNFLELLTDPLPGKIGGIEKGFWEFWTGAAMAVGGLCCGYIFETIDVGLNMEETSKKYNIPRNDDALKWTAWVADGYVDKCEPGTGYMFCKRKDGTIEVSAVEEE